VRIERDRPPLHALGLVVLAARKVGRQGLRAADAPWGQLDSMLRRRKTGIQSPDLAGARTLPRVLTDRVLVAIGTEPAGVVVDAERDEDLLGYRPILSGAGAAGPDASDRAPVRSPGAKPRGYRPALAKPALKRPMTSGTTWKVCQ
jgi:hypothetical protein